MKVSINEIKRIGYNDIVDLPINTLVDKIGAQLGAVEEVEDLGAKYKGVVVVRVVSCGDHPDADRLHVCKVDDGGVVDSIERDEDGYVQVVCGAPNVHADMFVAWLPPGSTVPETYHHEAPFVLEARALRGVVSNGMLASPKELALGDSHEGILEVDVEAKPGTPFADVYELNDHIIDIENKMFTHRPDCFGLIGVARELAGIQGKVFKSPDWYISDPHFETGDSLPLTVANDTPDDVPRFMAIAIKDVAVKPSPMWLQTALIRLGSRPINNIVDVTNYVMLLTGQPLHAYDYDKLRTGKLGVRRGKTDEKVALLNGKDLTVTENDIVITDGEKAIALGGVMGGSETEVDDTTKNIVLECATFDMYAIRRTSMRHGLFTDAVTRFNKGQSPRQNAHVLSLAVMSVHDVAGGTVASKAIDEIKLQDAEVPVSVTSSFINERLGTSLESNEMASLLKNVEFRVDVQGETLDIGPPFWRTDIEIAEDVVEEVGRLLGYDKLPLVLPKRAISPAVKNPLLTLKQQVRTTLARAGANELLTYSFVHKNLFEKTGQDSKLAFELTNALSPELQYYRITVLPSLLEKVYPNLKAGHNEFGLFEMGKMHTLLHADDDDGLPSEGNDLSYVYAAHDKLKKKGAAFYNARRTLDYLAAELGFELDYVSAGDSLPDFPLMKPYEPTRSAFVRIKGSENTLGIIGELRAEVREKLKLPISTAAFELDMDQFVAAEKTKVYVPLSRFPGVEQDVTVTVSTDTLYADIVETMAKNQAVLELKDVTIVTTPKGIYRPTEGSTKNITFHITAASYERTLSDKEVSGVIEKLTKSL